MKTATPPQPQKKTMAGSGRAANSRSIRHAIDDAPGSPRTRSQAAPSTRGSNATLRPSSKTSRSRDRRPVKLNVPSTSLGRIAAPDSSDQLSVEHHRRLLFWLNRFLEAWGLLLSG